MKINEVEELLQVTRANVRFYEKEGLLVPQRNSNGYRDYSKEDIARLKKIIIFRKLGFSISDIKAILDGTLPLGDALQENIQKLNEQIEELSGALEVCRIIEKDDTAGIDFDEEHYWEVIHTQEENGLQFKELLMDYLEFEKKSFISMWAGPFFYDLKDSVKKHGWTIAMIILLLICVIRGLAVEYVWNTGSFLSGFSYPFMLFGFMSLISLPPFLLNRKYKDVALSEEEDKKDSIWIKIGKVFFVIAYLPAFMLGIPLLIEKLYFNKLMTTEPAYIITSGIYIIYFIAGMGLFCILVFLYSKKGVFPDRFTGEPGIKAHLPHKVKRKVTALSLAVFFLAASLFICWYDCITETGVRTQRFFFSKTYSWEDVEYYTLRAQYGGTLDYVLVMNDGEHISCFGNSICFNNLDETKYADGTEDFCLSLSRMFEDMGVPLKVDDWDKLYDGLDSEYWQEYVDTLRSVINTTNK